jgi:hypothetical protein
VTDSANFLAPIPSEITASGSVTFGDGSYQSTLHPDDFVFARVHITAPLQMVIPETEINTDITSENIDQGDIDAITDHLLEAKFTYNVINHLPLGARVEIYLGTDSANLFTNYLLRLPKDPLDTIYVPMAPVDLNGIVTDTAATGFRDIYLDSSDVQILKNQTLYIGQKIVLEDSNGIAVKLTQNDFIKIIGRIEVAYRFDGNF